jgi:type II secretory pathway component PulF
VYIQNIRSLSDFDHCFADKEFTNSASQGIFKTLAWAMNRNIPLDEALNCYISDMPGNIKQKELARKSVKKLREGQPLHQALKPLKIYIPLYIYDILKAAEEEGVTDKVIEPLADQIGYTQNMVRLSKSVYFFAFMDFFQKLSIILFITVFLIPKILKIHNEITSGRPLPYLTQLVYEFTHYIPSVFLYFLLFFTIFIIIKSLYRKIYFIKNIVDMLLLKIPFTGKETKKILLMEVCGFMHALTASGLDVITAAEISTKACRNFNLKRKLEVFVNKLKEGENWREAWCEMNFSLPFYDWLASSKRRDENISSIFLDMIKFLRVEISHFFQIFLTVSETVLILLNAVVIGFFVIGLGIGIWDCIYGALQMGTE